jgi:hypothetical protein
VPRQIECAVDVPLAGHIDQTTHAHADQGCEHVRLKGSQVAFQTGLRFYP